MQQYLVLVESQHDDGLQRGDLQLEHLLAPEGALHVALAQAVGPLQPTVAGLGVVVLAVHLQGRNTM
jgi:hypothetical protein